MDNEADAIEVADSVPAYNLWFVLTVFVVGAVYFYDHHENRNSRLRGSDSNVSTSGTFKQFQRIYLMVYYMMMAGDWLQGPYVYALYSSYGFEKADIAVLFVAGFGSSMIFGTFIGSLADRLGRKKFCQLYVLLYVASCLTKHVNSYRVLMVGRLLGGVATSLLFSVFDTWLVCEHNARSYDSNWLSETFALAIFGNSVVAIVSGVVAQGVADAMPLSVLIPGDGDTTTSGLIMFGGYCSPFDLAIIVLLLGLIPMTTSWRENYGSSNAETNTSAIENLKIAVDVMRKRPHTILIGMISSLFEGAMYTFVFMWTPAISVPGGPTPPYGMIFAMFMVCTMGGSVLFSILMRRGVPPGRILGGLLCTGCVALMAPVVSSSPSFSLAGFLLFEMCVGLYFPACGTLKSALVPDFARAAIYNLFRVPLNLIVLVVLLGDFDLRTAFVCASTCLGTGAVLTAKLLALPPPAETDNEEKLDEFEMGTKSQAGNSDELDDLLPSTDDGPSRRN